jgi:hypothetical protein
MPLTLDWQSDGPVACLALVVYAAVVFTASVALGSKVQGLRRSMPSAVLWHLVVLLFVSLWYFPSYDAMLGGDARGYHDEAIRLAGIIRAGHPEKISLQLGTAAVPVVTAILYTPFGGDIYGMLLFCSALSLLSAVVVIKAFAKSCRPVSGSRYYFCILFMPSITMWTSVLGKDSIVAFGMALIAYGVATAFKNGLVRALLPLCCGLALVAAVRIHIALVLIVAAAAAALWPQMGSRKVGRLGTAALLIGVILILVPITASFVGLRELTLGSAVERQFELGDNSNYGGSAFGQDSGNDKSLARIPIGMWNLVARPYPWEAHNANGALAAAENIFIIWLVACALGRARHVWSSVRVNRYLLFCAFTAVGLLMVLSAYRNAGTISRERVQILPFLLAVLLAANVKRRLPSRIFQCNDVAQWRKSQTSYGVPWRSVGQYDVLSRVLREGSRRL